jgi:superfamily II DNA or RNA helicase
MEEIKKPNKMTRKRCPNGQRFDKNENKCLPFKGKDSESTQSSSLFPTSIFGNVMNTSNMEEKEKGNPRKMTRKRCPNGQRFDKNENKCLPFNKVKDQESNQLSSLFPSSIFGNVMNTSNMEEEEKEKEKSKPKKMTRKRCPNGQHFDKNENHCEPFTKKENPHIELVNKTVRKTKKKRDLPLEPVVFEEEPKMISEEPIINNPELFESPPPIIEDTEHSHNEIKENTTKFNEYLFNKEKDEYYSSNTETPGLPEGHQFLYPELNDSEFSYKIAKRKEFADTKYDGNIYDIEEQAELLCNSEFELMPHQLFVKNFLSFQTPYNSLLLYHGLGSGKTCSAIGIAEEMRSYMKQTGITKQIIVVASPNVQDNFRLQLFDERKLKEENGMWNMNSCIGNTLLNEINPTHLSGLTRERIITQINAIIRQYYHFMGYNEFANYISKKTAVPEDAGYSKTDQKELTIQKIKTVFNNRLLIIDEIHNLTLADNKQKRTSQLLNVIAKHSENMRLLLLSATPMYNSYEEIIWIANLMNTNDKRSTIDTSDVFDRNGNFKKPNGNYEGGKELLKRKLTGYVSYVRGENPYSFPYRVYPKYFAPDRTLEENQRIYPTKQMNQKLIDEPLLHVPVYLNDLGEYQSKGYQFIMMNLSARSLNQTDRNGLERIMPTFENMDTFGYTLLHGPLASLNIIYPNKDLDKMISDFENGNLDEESFGSEEISQTLASFVGEKGLNSVVKYKSDEHPVPLRHSFEYYPEVLKEYGRVFSQEKIHKYSKKIATICECIKQSKGIVLVYSQFIDGGSVPIALALEEMGFSRFGTASHTKNLFKNPPREPIDSITMKTRQQMANEGLGTFKPAKYVMITGHKEFSPNNYEDVKYSTNPDNLYGEKVKVILISKAAAEGLDFKNIRQIHILEPWYNMNRIEQIIGRGVRNQSHCGLPFEERNVEIYLHSTLTTGEEEAADLYVYRMAEKKALQIGKVTRLLKEVAVDCLLNIGQTNFTEDKLAALIEENKNIKIHLASGEKIDYKIGDKPYTDVCDYMDNCAFQCSAKTQLIPKEDIIRDTYNTDFMKTNSSTLMKRIRDLFREKSIYHRKELVKALNIVKVYPREQIYYALTQFIDNKTEELIDKYERVGYLLNRGDYYLFQPNEITDENASIYERVAPVDYKREKLLLELPEKVVAQQIPTKALRKEKKTKDVETDIITDDESVVDDYDSVLSKINELMERVSQKKVRLNGKEKDWYLHLNNVLELLRFKHRLPIETIYKYTIFHILDFLSFSERLVLLKYVYSKKNENHNSSGYEIKIKSYFDEKIVEFPGNRRGIVLIDMKNLVYLVQSNESPEIWTVAKHVDEERIRDIMNTQKIDSSRVFPVIGFIHEFKGRNELCFKIKNMVQNNNKNNKGARADQASKQEIVTKLNLVLGEEEGKYDKSSKFPALFGIVAMLEILMRYKTDIGEANMFFSPENALLNNVIEA